ncbi:hypothetical protein, partial [Stenotrophomonas maltophilia]|uniref:hypothetical protein n=1 Tax=Stenotrophomonas maltophilia TaxID=40324 RepID=UPI0019534896
SNTSSIALAMGSGPAIIIIAFFAILNYLLITFFGIANIQSFISESITDLFSNIQSPFWSLE